MPPLDELNKIIVDQGITGSVLMLTVDHGFLINTCKITKLGQRAAVFLCIEKLRTSSQGYKSRDEPAKWADFFLGDEPMQIDTVDEGPSDQQGGSSPDKKKGLVTFKIPKDRLIQLLAGRASSLAQQPPITPAIGDQIQPGTVQTTSLAAPDSGPNDHVRVGETFVEGQNGKKRRRLDLSAAQQPSTTASPKIQHTDLGLYLPEREHSIDRIFFGDTRFGRELGPPQITHPRFVVEDPVRECFQYINFDPQLGTTSYIHAKTSHFLRKHYERDLVRHQAPAKAFFPYDHNLQAERFNDAPQYDRKGRILFGGSRSAIVVQRPAAGANVSVACGLVALREDEDVLDSKAHELGFTQEQIAELSGAYSDLLLKWQPTNESKSDETTQDRVTEVESETDTDFGDDQAEEEDDEGDLSSVDVERVIQSAIDGYIAKWKETKLPTLEVKSAWTTWRKMKGIKQVREALIQGARSRIQELETRIRRYEEDIQHEKWSTQASLEKQCEVLEVSVHDIQKEFWKIDVWQRRHEPDHITARRATHKRTASGPSQAQPPNELQQALQNMDPGDRLSVSPQLRSLPPPVDAEPGDTRESEAEGERFHTPQGSPTPRSEHSQFIVPDDDEGGNASAEPVEATADAAMAQKDTLAPLQTTNTDTSPIAAVATPSSSRFRDAANATLPSPSALSSSRQEKESPAVTFIDMTQTLSSPAGPQTPALTKPKPKRQKTGHNAFQEVPTTSEADGWSFEQMEERADRKRIVIKLLRDMGLQQREELHKALQNLGFKKFCTQLLSCVDLITHQGEEEKKQPSQVDGFRVKTMKCAAYLYLAWYFIRRDAYGEGERLPSDSDILKERMPDPCEVDAFVQFLRKELSQRSHPLYSGVKLTTMDNPITIDTDDDEDGDPLELDEQNLKESSPKKRRRKVKRDVAAENSRSAAKARSQHHTQVLSQQQSSNPAVLQGMINDDPSQCAINPVRDLENDDQIFIRNKIAQAMKQYQLDSVRFMWRELTADRDEAQGCLLAHTMGLGKTMQSIALIACVDDASKSGQANIRHQLPKDLQLKKDRKERSLRFLVICPPSLIENWHNEIRKWAPKLPVYTVKSSAGRSDLDEWSNKGGVMLIGYQIFRGLVDCKPKATPSEAVQRDLEEARRILVEDTELVIADEAHNVKNLASSTAMAVAKIQSKARIALSGTPMSNDVDEIYAVISWVAPGYLGDRTFFGNFYGGPIKEGLYAESDRAQKRTSTIKLKNLHSEIEPKVNRADISVLKGSLQPKVEFILTVELTEQQSSVYAQTVTALLSSAEDLHDTATTRIFSWLAVLGQLTAHPCIFKRRLLTPRPPQKRKEKTKDKDDAVEPQAVQGLIANVIAQDAGDEASGVESEHSNESPEPTGEEDTYALGFTKVIVDALTQDLSDDMDPALSAKTRLLRQILELSKKCNDKVLVFSSTIPTLDYLSEVFRTNKIRFNRIDGSVPNAKRTERLEEFQSGNLDVMLLSTRASGQGLNIQAANRVVIFDFGFNPAWEEQAIGRAYRLGQKKPVFVYRVVAGGTFESNIYNTQMFKTTLAKRVIDKKNTRRNAKRNTKEYLYTPRPVAHDEQNIKDELKNDLDPNVMSKILKAQVDRTLTDPSLDICAIGTMETLQKEAPDEELDEEANRVFEANKIAWRMGKEGHAAPATVNASAPSLVQPGQQPPSSTAPNFVAAQAARMASAPSATQAAPYQSPQPPPGAATPVFGRNHANTSSLPPTDLRAQAASTFGMGDLPYTKK